VTEGLPFFVYGTLRRGGTHHDWALAGRIAAPLPAELPGAALYPGPGYPYAVATPQDPAARVHGELIIPSPGHYAGVLRTLDRLESYVPGGTDNQHYVRQTAEVVLADGGRRPAWVYLAAPALAARLRATTLRVPGGTWPPPAG
jgi:gamma-glutamylcyclotransferase (GGCT)/AIG2-like uncharacterized protein YtfP